MTEKRFSIEQTTINECIVDNTTGEQLDTIDYTERLCDLLNELNQEAKDNEHYHTVVLENYKAISKENEQLKKENDWLHKSVNEATNFIYDNFEVNRMFTDRELNDICNDMGWELSEKGIKLKQLEKENEQLKAQLQKGEDVCGICKYQYLTKRDTDKYYIAKCKKEHNECSKGTVNYCEDFKCKEG